MPSAKKTRQQSRVKNQSFKKKKKNIRASSVLMVSSLLASLLPIAL